MENKIFYKISYKNSIVIFFHDLEKDIFDGMIEETRTENSLKITKYNSSSCYRNVRCNTVASSMLKKAKEISKSEYETAVLVVDSMIGTSDLWLIADNDFEEKEVVKTETVYV